MTGDDGDPARAAAQGWGPELRDGDGDPARTAAQGRGPGLHQSAEKRWYESVWVAFGAGYVFAPLGLYLMWRYQDWPVWVKAALTAFGLAAMVIGTWVSSTYVMPRLF